MFGLWHATDRATCCSSVIPLVAHQLVHRLSCKAAPIGGAGVERRHTIGRPAEDRLELRHGRAGIGCARRCDLASLPATAVSFGSCAWITATSAEDEDRGDDPDPEGAR